MAFFYPIINDDYQRVNNNHIDTVLSYFKLKMAYENAFTFTRSETVILHNSGKMNEFFACIIDKYKKFEKYYNFFIVEGTDFFNKGSPFIFDINNFIAKDLNFPVILVVNEENKFPQVLADHILIERNIIQDKDNKIIIIVVNKAEIPQAALGVFFQDKDFGAIILSAIPPKPLLKNPTMK
ncbi:MAG: AAA family ATPase [Flavobacteriales bacterium AspAUS03]